MARTRQKRGCGRLGDARVSASTHAVRVGSLIAEAKRGLGRYHSNMKGGYCGAAQSNARTLKKLATALAREAKNVCWHQGQR